MQLLLHDISGICNQIEKQSGHPENNRPLLHSNITFPDWLDFLDCLGSILKVQHVSCKMVSHSVLSLIHNASYEVDAMDEFYFTFAQMPKKDRKIIRQ